MVDHVAPKQRGQSAKSRILALALVLTVLVICVVTGVWFWRSSKSHESCPTEVANPKDGLKVSHKTSSEPATATPLEPSADVTPTQPEYIAENSNVIQSDEPVQVQNPAPPAQPERKREFSAPKCFEDLKCSCKDIRMDCSLLVDKINLKRFKVDPSSEDWARIIDFRTHVKEINESLQKLLMLMNPSKTGLSAEQLGRIEAELVAHEADLCQIRTEFYNGAFFDEEDVRGLMNYAKCSREIAEAALQECKGSIVYARKYAAGRGQTVTG